MPVPVDLIADVEVNGYVQKTFKLVYAKQYRRRSLNSKFE